MALPTVGAKAELVGADKFVSDLDRMEKSLTGVNGSLEGTGKSAASASTGFSEAGKVGGKLAEILGNVFTVASGFIVANVFGKLAAGVRDFMSGAFEAAARTQELSSVLEVIGGRAGYTKADIDELVGSVKAMGIETATAQTLIIQMSRYQLDMSRSAELARLAQDAAVISMQNSSEALAGLIHGITTFNPRVLRTYGIIVNMQEAFETHAQKIGKSKDELSNAEKVQAAFNAVMAEGPSIAGSYEAAMENVGKQVRSLVRYKTEAQEAIGQLFIPAVEAGVGVLKTLYQTISDNQPVLQNFSLDLDGSAEAMTDLTAEAAPLITQWLLTTKASVDLDMILLDLQDHTEGTGGAFGDLADAARDAREGMLEQALADAEVSERVVELLEQYPELEGQLREIAIAARDNVAEQSNIVHWMNQEAIAAEDAEGALGQFGHDGLRFITDLFIDADEQAEEFNRLLAELEANAPGAAEAARTVGREGIAVIGQAMADAYTEAEGWRDITDQAAVKEEQLAIKARNAAAEVYGLEGAFDVAEDGAITLNDDVDALTTAIDTQYGAIQRLQGQWKETFSDAVLDVAELGEGVGEFTNKFAGGTDLTVSDARRMVENIQDVGAEIAELGPAFPRDQVALFQGDIEGVATTIEASDLPNLAKTQLLLMLEEVGGAMTELGETGEGAVVQTGDVSGRVWEEVARGTGPMMDETLGKVNTLQGSLNTLVGRTYTVRVKVEMDPLPPALVGQSPQTWLEVALRRLESYLDQANPFVVEIERRGPPEDPWMPIREVEPPPAMEELVGGWLGAAEGLARIAQGMAGEFRAQFIDPIDAELQAIFDPLNEAMGMGKALSTFGSAVGGRFTDQVIDPLKNQEDLLAETLEALEEQAAGFELSKFIDPATGLPYASALLAHPEEAEEFLVLLDEMEQVQGDLADVSGERAEKEAKLLELQQKQADLAFLQQQIGFLDFLRDQGLDVQEVLGDVELGMDTDIEDLLEATTRALEATVNQAEGEFEGVQDQQERINELLEERLAMEEELLELQQQQADLAFLQQQLNLINTLAEAGIDPESILGGIELGIGANVDELIGVMSVAVQALIEAANEELGASSPARALVPTGEDAIGGIVLGMRQALGPALVEMQQITSDIVSGVMPRDVPVRAGATLAPQPQVVVVEKDARSFNATFQTNRPVPSRGSIMTEFMLWELGA